MTYREYAILFHENAERHGWWETPRAKGEIFALIHSEWSEALEEYRNGMPERYFGVKGRISQEPFGEYKKPEGISVELIDGVIRILDYLALTPSLLPDTPIEPAVCLLPLPVLAAELHALTSDAYRASDGNTECKLLLKSIETVFGYVSNAGLDPVYILEEKHHYNETRSYRHGAKKA